MTNEQIEKFLDRNYLDKVPVQVNFKTRKSFVGVFIKTPDFDDLKAKNFWRIVAEANHESYIKSKNMNLVRLFNGVEITKLVSLKPEATTKGSAKG